MGSMSAPCSQRLSLDELRSLPAEQREALLSTLSPLESEAILRDWRGLWARPDQLAPLGDWLVWLILSGRGWGKTRTAAEWVIEQVELHGPADLPLRSATVQTFALALHELTTNAVKYGALSSPVGRLAVSWARIEEDGERWLRVDWRETGVTDVPHPSAPARGGGYGRELIERALPYQFDARTTYVFLADGLHCSIQLPLDREDPAS